MSKPLVKIKLDKLKVSYEKKIALQYQGSYDLVGNTIALVGHNGAGKSTFIKSILGLLNSSSGSIGTYWSESGGSDFQEINPQDDMAFCPESGSVFRDITVESYVKLWCRMKCSSPSYYKKEGAKFIELLDVDSILSKFGRELSKGQRRRVQTAIGFIIQPKLFLIDEPFDGLDVQRTHELGEIIRENSNNMCFIISSHRMDVMERVSDYVIVLKGGEFAHYGPLSKVATDLGGASYTIEHEGSSGEQLSKLIQEEFPDSVITRHGAEGSILTLTIKNTGIPEITSYLAQKDFANSRIEKFQPSLVDAMTLHLKQS